MKQITTIQGDAWDLISYREYGDERLMHLLIEANYDLRSVVIFSAGTEVNVPEVEAESRTPAPPWV